MAVAVVKSIEDLLQKVRLYNPGADLDFIRKAYFYSFEAHGEQLRVEGTPFIEHPLAVASILADMKMDTVSIAAAVLHDTVEDTLVTKEDIEKRFGYELAFLVDAVTKIGKIQFHSKEEAQAENFRKMLLSMAEDIRVIIVKLADRLHNMRTLMYLSPAKRQSIARETLDIYAPLANRLGIGWLRLELEDLSFKYLYPTLYEDMVKKVALRKGEQEGYINNVISIVNKKLADEGMKARVMGRVKHYYGIYQKMQRQGIAFEQINDVLGIRIITDTKANCYAILGLIHSLWKPIPGRFKDFIGVPKSNMYQSLHTTVIAVGGKRVEFQIRTEDMHRVAEEGIAAHWRYKERGQINPRDDLYISWLRNFVHEIQDVRHTPREFLDAVKSEVVPETIYVFTPNGDIKELPVGSTPVDFAYAIHTAVGNKCTGAKVNGRMVPLRHKLNNGDTVEVVTSASQTPSRDWLGFVVTQRAKTRIKQFIKAEERNQSLELGTKLLETELRKKGVGPAALKSDNMDEVALSFKMPSRDDLVVAVGYGKLTPAQVVNRLTGKEEEEEKEEFPAKPSKVKKDGEQGITITGMSNILYHVAKCCYPLPGDKLVGFITRGKGVSIHRQNCPNLPKLVVDDERLISVEWETSEDGKNLARILVDTLDKPGVLADLSAIISAANININHAEAQGTQFERARISFLLEVKDRAQLNAITQKLTQIEGVLRVMR